MAVVSLAFSQTNNFKFTHLSNKDGLSQSSVIAICQDALGQIWVGTRDGLNKYDGTQFTVYRTNTNNSNSLSNNDILCLEEDRFGNIWIGTYNGLNKYNPKTDTFTRYYHTANKSSLCNNTVWDIKELTNGDIWVGTSTGLSIYKPETNTFLNYSEKIASKYRVLSIQETKNNQVFIGTSRGLGKLEKQTPDHLDIKLIEGSSTLHIQDLLEAENNNILIATKSSGVLEYHNSTNSVKQYLLKSDFNDENINVRRLLYDNDNNLWVGTYNGLAVVGLNKKITVLKSNFNDSNSLTKNSIKSLFKDKKGSIWVGTYYGGLNIWDKSNVNFINITQKHNNLGLSYSVVSSIANHKGQLFFGTEGGGITIFNKNNNTYNYINKTNSAALKDDNIKALSIINNQLWVGTFSNGLVVYSPSKKTFITNKLPEKITEYLANTGVYAIKKDNNNNIWIGTFGKGLIRYNILTKSFTLFKVNQSSSNSITSNLIRSIVVDKHNAVWVGTQNGLNKINTNGSVNHYFYDKKLNYGDDILTVFEDDLAGIWVGVNAKGLFKLNKNNRFVPVNLNLDKVSIANVHGILQDNNFLWLSTNQGLVKYHTKNKKAILYSEKDGLVGNEFSNNSVLKLDASKFYFGGAFGVTYFNSQNIISNLYAPQVLLTGLKVNYQSIKINSEKAILSTALPYTKNVYLNHDQGNFSLSFSIPSFINSKNNKYKYRLKGVDKNWNITSKNNVSYTIQKSGHYIFEVLGANGNGLWNTTPTQLKIKVNPAPWRSWWAFLLYGLIIFSLLYYLIQILKQKSKLKHDLELESIEAKKTREINKSKLEFFTNISHEFRTPLTLIVGPLSQVINNYRGTSTMYKKLLVVESSANHLLHLINRLMDFRKFENNLYKLEAAEGNVVNFLKEIYLSFTEFAKVGGYSFEFNVSHDNIVIYFDRYKLERVFYNIISNAFKYTPKGGVITISVKQTQTGVTIAVQDSGVGLSKSNQDKIFDRFYEVNPNNSHSTNHNRGTGIGLSIAKNIVELHQGKIFVSSNGLNQGTTFKVELRAGKNHLNDNDLVDDFKTSGDISQYQKQLTNLGGSKGVTKSSLPKDKFKKTILLVEDNSELRIFIKGVLLDNYNVVEAVNGNDAFKIANKENIDLIVSDVMMPEMTGTELCAAIKSNLKTSHIPIILLTARTSLIFKLEGLERGADDYINKPFNVQEFLIRIENLLKATSRLKARFQVLNKSFPEELPITSIDEELYKKALNIVKDNIANEAFDVTSFASQLGVSRTMLFTKIKAWSNFTPNEFILNFRMQLAAQLLEQGKLNISQVSYRVGFKDPKYFSKCFSKKHGYTPTGYKNKFSL